MQISVSPGAVIASAAAMLFAFASPLPALAQSAPLSLSAAVRQGIDQAPILQARQADIDASRDDVDRAGRLPDPALSVGVSNFPVTAPGAFDIQSDNMTMRVVGLSQSIPSLSARHADKNLAYAKRDVASANAAWTSQQVRERIANAWIDVWAANKRLALLQGLREETRLAVKITTAQLRSSEGNVPDALAARAEAQALDNQLDAATAQLQAAQASLHRWLPDTATDALAAAPDFTSLPVSPAHLVDTIDRQAPMQPWQAREQSAQAQLERARANRHPNWSVGVSYGHRSEGLADTVTFQLGMSLPLFATHRQDRDVGARIRDRDAIAFAHEDARRAQRELIQQTLARWKGAEHQITRDEQTLLPLARDRSRTALAAARSGASLQPWIDARRAEIELRLAYVDALTRHAQQWAALAYLLPSPEIAP